MVHFRKHRNNLESNCKRYKLMYDPQIGLLLAAASVFFWLLILSVPATIIYLYCKRKKKRRKELQVQYDCATLSIKNQLERYLIDGLAVSQEIWELPSSDTAAELFFEFLEKTATQLGKTVFYLGNGTNSKWLQRFHSAGLLTDNRSPANSPWIIELQKIGGKTDLPERSIDLRLFMAPALNLYNKLILAGS